MHSFKYSKNQASRNKNREIVQKVTKIRSVKAPKTQRAVSFFDMIAVFEYIHFIEKIWKLVSRLQEILNFKYIFQPDGIFLLVVVTVENSRHWPRVFAAIRCTQVRVAL